MIEVLQVLEATEGGTRRVTCAISSARWILRFFVCGWRSHADAIPIFWTMWRLTQRADCR